MSTFSLKLNLACWRLMLLVLQGLLVVMLLKLVLLTLRFYLMGSGVHWRRKVRPCVLLVRRTSLIRTNTLRCRSLILLIRVILLLLLSGDVGCGRMSSLRGIVFV